MSLYDIVVPLGIASLSLALITVVFGFFRKLLPAKPRVLIHKVLGFLLLLVAATHGAIILYFKLFMN
jgi:hypothetical protein